ncbi:MAG: hypothetical protein MR419_01485 [Clostridiales bacterium]|nr:hypothetical protein [Clostridiales bacterium]MDY4172146.1 hypothetical protein [Evtepia sp.]
MYTIALLERGPGLSRFLAAHLPPDLGAALRRGAVGGRADLTVVSPDLVQVPASPLPCRVLLLPGSLAHLAQAIPAAWVVSYGLSSRDTLTLSSLASPCLTLQRELVTLSGDCLEPQEFPLPHRPQGSPLHLLAWAGVQLLLGTGGTEIGG